MADTIRHRILQALVEHIEAHEFVTTNSIPVNPGKTRYRPEDLPAISVFARTEEADLDRYGRQQCSLSVEINYAGVIDRDAEGEKTSILDQIETVRGKLLDALVTATLNDIADPPVYTGGVVEYPSEEDMAFVASVEGRIDYETDLQDPYTQ